MGIVGSVVRVVLSEPPLRLLMRGALLALPASPFLNSHWDASPRPHYLHAVLYAADQARRQRRSSFAAIEFGVAEGAGLLTLQRHAEEVEARTGIRVRVYGFDMGTGLPQGTGDYRDHPDQWMAGDFWMDVPSLKAKLTDRTELILGNIRETVGSCAIEAPLGFVAIDVDFYSSTVDALRLLCRPDVGRLHRVALYFDDARMHWNHRYAGELLAIEEFNARSASVKIDQWRGLRAGRAFPDAAWIEGMYLAHDLEAITRARPGRPAALIRDVS